jgi:hypothetical protein
MNQNKFKFDGSDYIPDRDDVRLSGQILRVWECMKDEKWRTLREISNATGDPEASISAQLRHLRKPKFGGYDVEKEYISNGLFKYKLLTQGKEKLL